MKFTGLDNALWVCSSVANVCLFGVLFVKSRITRFPIFSTFVVYQIATSFALYLVHHYGTRHQYFLAYWAIAIGGYCFQIALIYELARHVLRPAGLWVTYAQRRFIWWSFAGFIGTAVLVLFVNPPARSGLDLWSIRSSIFTSFFTCEVFLAMSSAANKLRLHRSSQAMMIGEGLTVWAVVALCGDLAHYLTGWADSARQFSEVEIVAYIAAVTLWTVAFSKREKEVEPLSPGVTENLHSLHDSVRQDLRTLTSTTRRPSK